MASTSPTKPGYTTTEFWTTLIVHAITVVAVVMSAFGHTFDGSALQPLVPAISVLASAVAQAVYTVTRGKVKQSIAQNSPKSIV